MGHLLEWLLRGEEIEGEGEGEDGDGDDEEARNWTNRFPIRSHYFSNGIKFRLGVSVLCKSS